MLSHKILTKDKAITTHKSPLNKKESLSAL